jgi:hypothetical protein
MRSGCVSYQEKLDTADDRIVRFGGVILDNVIVTESFHHGATNQCCLCWDRRGVGRGRWRFCRSYLVC